MAQNTQTILMVRPASFGFNTETANSNTFQKKVSVDAEKIAQLAQNEFNLMVESLRNLGITVEVFEDSETPQKPDAVFPNNWITFHQSGEVLLYPMFTKNRRLERNVAYIDTLKQNYFINKITDFTAQEDNGKILEGTGSIIFDHEGKNAYACLSPRTNQDLFIEVAEYLGYNPIFFTALDGNGIPIYHTNVMLTIGKKFAIICMDSITDKEDRKLVRRSLINADKEIIEISLAQMSSFVGNMIELTNGTENLLVMSQTALHSLNQSQQHVLSKFAKLVPVAIPTIEKIGGGSARCMIAEIFNLPLKKK
ncbi:MAG: citrulline utilization hydrolase CtlX [Luteibaculaceae bacterium]